MVQTVQTKSDGTTHYEQLTQLDGRLYKLVFWWNDESEHWTMSVRTEADEPIQGCEGLRLVQNWQIMRLARDVNRPPGAFVVQSEKSDEPGLFDLGQGTGLYYIPESELP